MAPFDDSADLELGAACNRLAAWVETLPANAMIDEASSLTETDLALILRYLHATRLGHQGEGREPTSARASVPITAKS